MLAQVLSLYRDSQGFAGTVRCDDEHLPIASESLSLVYSLCVLETSPNPEALFEEMVRCLKPEGVIVLLSLNAISPTRLRWQAKGINPVGSSVLRQMCAKQGLEISRLSQIGPVWLSPQKKLPRYQAKPGFLKLFYAGHILVASFQWEE